MDTLSIMQYNNTHRETAQFIVNVFLKINVHCVKVKHTHKFTTRKIFVYILQKEKKKKITESVKGETYKYNSNN